MRILAIKWRRLGDTVLWISALEALRRWSPGAEIDLAVPDLYLPLFSGDPRFAELHPLRRGTIHGWSLARKWRRKKFDWVLNFHASSRTALLAVASGARRRLIHHHDRKPRRGFSHLPVVDLGRVMAARDRDLNVVRTLGWTGEAPPTRLHVAPETKSKGLALLRDIFGDDSRPLVLLSPSASRVAKQWPVERYCALASRLAKDYRVGILTDNPAALKTAGPLSRELLRHGRIVPTPRLENLLGVVPHGACVVGSDSGIKHMACAVDVPTVTLFGPESVGEWHFYPEPRHRILRREVPCRSNDPHPREFAWCGESVCPLASHGCLSTLSIEEVESAVRSV